MIMTEEEARKKWCPLTFSPNASDGNKCEASGCMAWRSISVTLHKPTNVLHRGTIAIPQANFSEYEPQPSEGYCGLAGKPWSAS